MFCIETFREIKESLKSDNNNKILTKKSVRKQVKNLREKEQMNI